VTDVDADRLLDEVERDQGKRKADAGAACPPMKKIQGLSPAAAPADGAPGPSTRAVTPQAAVHSPADMTGPAPLKTTLTSGVLEVKTKDRSLVVLDSDSSVAPAGAGGEAEGEGEVAASKAEGADVDAVRGARI
jgi:hypothetical protein